MKILSITTKKHEMAVEDLRRLVERSDASTYCDGYYIAIVIGEEVIIFDYEGEFAYELGHEAEHINDIYEFLKNSPES